jgi:hypothetical protein
MQSLCIILLLHFASCEVDIQFTIKKDTNLTFDTVKFIDKLLTGNYSSENSTGNASNSWLNSLINKNKVAVLNASDLLCVNGTCIEEVLQLPPPPKVPTTTTTEVVTTTTEPVTTTATIATTTIILEQTNTTKQPTSSQPGNDTADNNTLETPFNATTTPEEMTTPSPEPTPTPQPSPVSTDAGGVPVVAIIFVILGVILVLVLVILYFVLKGSGAKDEAKTGKLLKSAMKSAIQQPHVLNIAIDWPPRPPPQIKMGFNPLQGRDLSHQA